LGTTNRDAGLCVLKEAAQNWTTAAARLNNVRALERLDWRWRLQNLAKTMSLDVPLLDADVELVRARISTIAAEC
jgi:hypothetical protein